MIGGWVGYVYVFAACGAALLLLAACTLVLYGVARVRERESPRVRVTAMGGSRAPVRDGSDAA